ncbi:MAG: polysaccharide deacetylase family protein [Rhizobiales bacterium]|nr:polysaccharide deacetylase family protein [Hyphomicrobiales bacterium]
MHGLKTTGYKAGLNALYWSGAHRLFAPHARGAGAILMFHHIRPASPSRFQPNAHLEVTPGFLAKVIQRTRVHGLDIVDLDEARRRLADRERGGRFVVLTFDDGYRNNFTEAYPILKAEAAPFTVYVATGLIDGTAVPWWEVIVLLIERTRRVQVRIGDRELDLPATSLSEKRVAARTLARELCNVGEDEQRAAIGRIAAAHGIDTRQMLAQEMMDWDEIRALSADPLATIGAHTVGHYALARLDPRRARREMIESRERIEVMTGKRPRHFAYPYGSLRSAGQREFDLAAELGFATAVTTRRGVLGPRSRLTALPRISMNGHYQSAHYIDLLLSGVPIALERRIRGWVGRNPSASAR